MNDKSRLKFYKNVHPYVKIFNYENGTSKLAKHSCKNFKMVH